MRSSVFSYAGFERSARSLAPTKRTYRRGDRSTILRRVVLAGITWFSFGLAYADPPEWLTEVFHGTNYDIYYAIECPADSAGCNEDELVPPLDDDGDGHPNRVEELSAFLDELREEFVTTFSLNEPYFSTSPGRVYLTGNCNGNYDAPRIRICAASTRLDSLKRILIHELFHGVQATYRAQPRWIREGQADMMTDQVFDVDDDFASSGYVVRSNYYLGDPNRYAITDVQQRNGYEAALFWKYFAEQFGTLPDPGQGMDAIRTLLETGTREGVVGIEAVNRALDILEPGTDFQDVYENLLITNYAHRLAGSEVPERYRIADEAEPLPTDPLNEVHLDVNDQAFGASSQVGPLTAYVQAWGARYYRIEPQADVPVVSIDVDQDTTSELFFAVLGIKDDNIAHEERFWDQHLSHALVNDPGDPFDAVVLIVGGLNHYANYRLNINGQRPILNILGPLTSRRAQAGDPDDPGKFVVMIELLDANGIPIRDIDPRDFAITVGTELVPGDDIITTLWVQGQYWMTVRAPNQTAEERYDLTVGWATLSDIETRSVEYAVRPVTDNMLVIDRSGSMADFNKMQGAKNAGNLYIDSWPDGDKVGVVSFSHEMSRDFRLADLNDVSRTPARRAVDRLEAGGNTSVGGGLLEALDEFADRGIEDHAWAIVLLSDAMENTGLDITDFWREYYTLDKQPTLHAIALGPDANRGKLQNLAHRTGGTFQYAGDLPIEADADDGVARSPLSSAPFETQVALELDELFRVIGETVAREQQIFVQYVDLDAAGTAAQTVEVPIDAHADEAVITLSWFGSSGLGYEGPPSASLVGPGGSVAVSEQWKGHLLWRLVQPEGGTWRVRIDCDGIEFCPPHYLVEASEKSDLTMDLAVTPGPDDRIQGLDVILLTALSDHQPVQGATVVAELTAPSGALHDVVLHDDGSNGDGAAGDGVYGARFYKTYEAGSYIVKITANGRSNLDEPFVRRIRGAFDVAPSPDSDADGLPDVYEDAHGSDPLVADADKDEDLDGLTTLDEYGLGTDPRASDSDHGGEADGSETARGSDPADPSDDVLDSHGELYVTPGDGVNYLRFEVRPEFELTVVYRSLSRLTGYSELARATATGRYEDVGLTNGQTYWYRVAHEDESGRATAPTDPVSGTPSADPVAPTGWVVINDDEPVTRKREVMLSLSSVDDTEIDYPTDVVGSRFDLPATEMRIANHPTMRAAAWEPFQPEKPWTLAVDEGAAFVYVDFRDAAGNVSDIAWDQIVVDPDHTPGTDLTSRYGLSLHYGQTIPVGSYDDDYDNEHSLMLDFSYRHDPRLSLVGLLGYHRFDAGRPGVDDDYVWNLSGNVRYEGATHPWRAFVQGGLGVYLAKRGSADPGININAGVNYSIDEDWDIDLSLQYHRVFGGSEHEFLMPGVGINFRF